MKNTIGKELHNRVLKAKLAAVNCFVNGLTDSMKALNISHISAIELEVLRKKFQQNIEKLITR